MADGSFMYTGNSMRRVFVPGDRLETCEVPFGEIQCGDVVVFHVHGEGIVHRVVRREDGALVTKGDNNDKEDNWRLRETDGVRLVTVRIDVHGNRHAVLRGDAGRREFRRHRLRRWCWRVVRKAFRLSEPLLFWRRELTERTVFGGTTVFYRNGKAVAKQTAEGTVTFYRPWQKLLYKVKWSAEE